MGHVVGDVTADATTVNEAIGDILADAVEGVARVVVDVVYTACITLFTSLMGVVLIHTVRDIDPGEPSNISFFRAVERTQKIPQSLRLKDSAPQNI